MALPAHSKKGVAIVTSGLFEFQMSEHGQEPLAMSKLVQLLVTQFVLVNHFTNDQEFELLMMQYIPHS